MAEEKIITFDYEALWSKSKVFIDRALIARDNQDQLGFHLWAALSLELLGKAVLAKIHPSLIADPNEFNSLLAACNRPHKANVKSITAKTVFERLPHVSTIFDEKMKKDCMRLMDRRNAELHSGDSPLNGLDDRAWVPNLWKIINTLLEAQEKKLEDLLTAEESKRTREILDDSAKLLKQTVLARISRKKKEFNERFPLGTTERRDFMLLAAQTPIPKRFLNYCDDYEQCECPSCGCLGWLLGFDAGDDVVDIQRDDTGWIEFVTKFFSAEEFRCIHCNLNLEGLEELSIAELPEGFEREEEREPDYSDEYGND